jgi:hypothetical protein
VPLIIDFRYHLVTIIAIFLALAVGIVVGTTALNGPVLDDLRGRNTDLIDDKRTLEADVRELQSDVSAADAFARELAPRILQGALDGRRVLLVTTDGSPENAVGELTPLLLQAGATVGGELRLQSELFDAANGQLIEDLVAQVVPAGVELSEGEPIERARPCWPQGCSRVREGRRWRRRTPRPSCRRSRRPTSSSCPTRGSRSPPPTWWSCSPAPRPTTPSTTTTTPASSSEKASWP